MSSQESVRAVNVLLTGASGNLGKRLAPVLAEQQDMRLTACDLKPVECQNHRVLGVNLLDLDAVKELTRGQDVVIHLGNHANFAPPDPYLIFNQNVCMNQHVMQSAADHGARLILFASSIQVISSTPHHHRHVSDAMPVYFPLDLQTPECCRNPYALSKLVGEQMLGYLCRQYGLAGRSVRFPWLVERAVEEYREISANRQPPLDDYFRPMGFAYLHYQDAIELVLRSIRAGLRGYGCYIPASEQNLLGLPLSEVIRLHSPGVRLKRPIEEIRGPVDQEHVRMELGWVPAL